MARFVCPVCRHVFDAEGPAGLTCPRCGARSAERPATREAVMHGSAASSGYTLAPPVPGHGMPGVHYNGMSVAAFVLGLIGAVTFFLVAPSLLALIFGILGRVQARSRGERGARLALIGAVLGGLVTLLVGLFWTVLLLDELA